MKYLDAEEILLIHHQLIKRFGGLHGTRNLEQIRSVAIAPAQHVFDNKQYKSIFDKASVYARNIILDHPFYDGNKRTGITTAIMFLMKNDYKFSAQPGEIEEFAFKIAVNKLGIKEISTWLEKHVSSV